MLRKIAVVGGNGFVGREVIAAAAGRGVAAIGIVRSSEGQRLVQTLGGVPFMAPRLDAGCLARLPEALSGCDGLVYTASVSTGAQGEDRTEPAGLASVLDACRIALVPRVVLFSGLGVARYGMNEHCTNPYFLAKMAGEVAAFRSGIPTTVFRPSYIFGTGDEFLTPLLSRMRTTSPIEIPGDGRYRLQPISVQDAARAVLCAIDTGQNSTQVLDLVGPEILSYRSLLGRVAAAMNRDLEITERPVAEAIALSRGSSYFGLRPHDLACLLCDEVSDPMPVETLVGGELDRVDAMIARVLERVSEGGRSER